MLKNETALIWFQLWCIPSSGMDGHGDILVSLRARLLHTRHLSIHPLHNPSVSPVLPSSHHLFVSSVVLYVHRNRTVYWGGRRMGQRMRAQIHLPVHTAPGFCRLKLSSSFKMVYYYYATNDNDTATTTTNY